MKFINYFFCIVFSFVFCFAAQAETKRALVIGINIYKPNDIKPELIRNPQRQWTNLDGAVNDAKSIKALLKSKFNFKEKNIVTLYNEQATRTNIINTIKNHLIQPAQKGDILTFYYAGHGSQAKNSQSNELDKLDETLVPADAILGSADIRDKELKQLFNQMINKGARLTAIFDSCHSGSIGRGIPRRLKTRRMRTTNKDLADSSLNNITPPESRSGGAVIFSATQDRDVAYEAIEEIEEAEKTVELPHGAFTLALINTLKATSPNEPVEKIFQRILTQMDEQTPVLAGPPQRLKNPLFSSQENTDDGKTHVAILDIDEEENEVLLQGGYAIGLRTKSILIHPVHKIELQITSVEDMVQSTARVIKGSISKLKNGDLVDVKTWSYSPQKSLKLWIPPAISADERKRLNQVIKQYQPELSPDPLNDKITHLLIRSSQQWQLITRHKEKVNLNLSELGQYIDSQSKLFIAVPPTPELQQQLKNQFKSHQSAIKITNTFEKGHYYLMGRQNAQNLEYAWVKSKPQSQLSTTSLPTQTNWIKLDKSSHVQLIDYIQRIAKLKAWLTLHIPSSSSTFPYKLALKNSQTHQLIQNSFQKLKANEIYGLVLIADREQLKKPEDIEQRYVYVFILDSNGNSTLLFPDIARGNAGNFLPLKGKATEEVKVSKARLFQVSPPFGTDTYILLTTAEPIPEPHIASFNSQGVKSTRSSKTNSPMPLVSLLFDIGSASRSNSQTMTYTSWSVQRLPLQSVK